MKEKRLSVMTILVAVLALAGMLFIAAAPATASE